MEKTIVKNERLSEEYIRLKHPSGLTILLYPMQGYSTAYALFGTHYGSINTTFKTDREDDYTTVPEGIAHFLEHKLFESEDGDAFSRFAQTGASANAFTSFDKTCYLFSAADNFRESLDILLDFVQKPYFTKETVQKEQGIIGQEIRMYEDDPDWRVYFNLLRAMYEKHPVRIDIAGTVESIAQIDDKILYKCYETFYNLSNMVLAIAGRFDVDVALEVIEKNIHEGQAPINVESAFEDEKAEVVSQEYVQALPVAMPMFNIGFKEQHLTGKELLRAQVETEMLLELIAGEASPLYRSLYEEGLINAEFSAEVFSGDGYFGALFGGESRDPREVYRRILEEIETQRSRPIDLSNFDGVKKLIYGRYVRGFNNVEGIAHALVSAQFSDVDIYDALEMAAVVQKEDLERRLQNTFVASHSAISIIEPTNDGQE